MLFLQSVFGAISEKNSHPLMSGLRSGVMISSSEMLECSSSHDAPRASPDTHLIKK